MPIRKQYTERQVTAALEAALDAWERDVVRWLCYVGEAAVAAARREGNYRDQTGNLRASVGYVVARNGRPLGDGGTLRAARGPAAQGRDYALRLAKGAFSGPVLVVVAGMQYARFVAARGYDVLDSAELTARRLLQQLAAGGGDVRL